MSHHETLHITPVNNPPYKGTLVNLILAGDENANLKKEAQSFKEHVLTPRQLCDLELILNGGFSPLTGFLNEDDYNG